MQTHTHSKRKRVRKIHRVDLINLSHVVCVCFGERECVRVRKCKHNLTLYTRFFVNLLVCVCDDDFMCTLQKFVCLLRAYSHAHLTFFLLILSDFTKPSDRM